MVPGTTANRWALEEAWRLKLDEARNRYNAVNQEYRRVIKETPGAAGANFQSVWRARNAGTEALAEYSRVLRIFTQLTVEGKLPEEQPAASLVAVIDDDESIRDSVQGLLRSAGYAVATFESAEAFLESGRAAETGCLILDIRMPGMGGLELQARVNGGDARMPIIFITAHDDRLIRQRAMQAGAMDVLHKPFAPNVLLGMVEAALGRQEGPN